MKNNLNNSSSPVTGRRYWRSLDELADTPEFKDWLHREFPVGASEMVEDGQSRRNFLKIMSASFAFAGIATLGAGCRRPEEKLVPYGKQPENYTFGEAQYFATAMPTRTGAVPLVVKSYEGRPVKIEGNALFPGSNGGTDRYAQASILDLYDPDRARHFKHDGKEVSREEALGFLDELSKKFSANSGEGLAFLAESSTSPSRARLQKIIAQKFPKSQWFTYDAIDSGIHQRAATQAFGQPVKPVFHFDKAKVILSLDCDFIGGEDDAHNHIRKFAVGRKAEQGMSRLYAVESLFTLTGASADHRLRVAANLIGEIGSAIAASIVTGSPVKLGLKDVDDKWISECANDLIKNHGNVLVVAGQRQPIEVHLLAQQLNAELRAIGNTVTLISADKDSSADSNNLNLGEADTLLIIGSNPAYNLNWSAKLKTVVRLGYCEDETSEKVQWNFPATHYLESWSDARTSDGTLVPIQPLIQPLFGGLTELEFLARVSGEAQTGAYEIVRATFDGDEESWKKFLFNGFCVDSKLNSQRVQPDARYLPGLPVRGMSSIDEGADLLGRFHDKIGPSGSSLEVVFYRDSKVDDGRYANNGWMQELPDPVTKMTWDNAVLISRKTARELGVANGDVVEISLNGKKVSGPIWVQPGMADYSLGLALGYGREKVGRVGNGVGFNAYKIFSGKYIETGATIRKTGETHTLACTQHHWSMEGRPAVREANLEEFIKEPTFAQEKFHGVEPPIVQSLYPNPLDEAKKTALHQWGMTVDLNACVGCGTCVIACQSENNIPIVGKDQVLRGREMHWMRIDRYFTSNPAKRNDGSIFSMKSEINQTDENQQFAEWIDDVQAVNQPMLCQQCESAPCENVCPVAATVHDQEGLNVMAYNRCIGTRYCSNNCPYKVRRFNYLDFNKRPLTELKGPIYSTTLTHKTEGVPDILRWWKDPNSGMRTEDEWDLIKLSKNPDVTVRMRGVMEKCTYCTQRIEHAKIAQKAKAGASDNVRLSEAAGTVPKTACQQACPAGAIVFGDVSDADSSVSKLKLLPQNYSVLGDLLTMPRTTYLARIRNPNPAMPDYRNEPFSTEEYESHSLTKKGNS
jgi:molybdopterin-containing oxidoreductase family iron-sulfur binding subunit